ncbi:MULTISPECIES: YfhO family protein [unclassified Carboxylicivirga]|uniref:YfhO family protein n=1 Tax=Carboxylicivirga TaxID=1628153 RepID=UPI003D326DA0
MFDKLKGYIPYLGAFVLFIILSFVYFSPVLEGKKLPQLDNTHAKAMSKELKDHEQETGRRAMWTNSMFGGMPAYQIKGDASKNIFSYLNKATRLGLPYETVAIVFLYMLGFYLLLLSMKVDHWLSVIGAIAFAFGSYNLIIIIAGHITKTYAIALMAPVVAGVLWSYNRHRFIGGVITAVALGMEVAYNHVQITYYLAFMVAFIVLAQGVYAIKEKAVKPFLQSSAVLLVAVMLAILPNITNLWTTYEYGQYSIRGASELTPQDSEKDQSAGLDVDYAFGWSYGMHETLTLLIPNVVGGESAPLANAEAAMQQVDPRLKEYVGQSSQYWGGRVFTSGPVYAGALVCFLFFIGAFYYKGKERWWLIAITVLSIMLAWGKNFPAFNYFMFYNFPLYNKFRTVEMALVLASMVMPLLGFLGLKSLLDNPSLITKDSKWFAIAFALTGGVSLVLALFPTSFYTFLSPMEAQQIGAQIRQGGDQVQMFQVLESSLIAARAALMTADAWRSFVFILLGSASLWLFAKGKLQKRYLIWGMAILVLVDLWGVSKRYLNNDDFVTSSTARKELAQSKADQAILKDKDYYRVFPIYRDPFKDGFTPYWHKSVGGFHGAKLRRFQDLADRYLINDWQTLMQVLQSAQTPGDLELALEKMPVLNMLNAKYIIYNPGADPIFNPSYMGNAWFVNGVKTVSDADAEIAALGETDLRATAVVDQRFMDKVQGYATDSVQGHIRLTHYEPDYLIFESSTPQQQLAVFSDVYYEKGWKAYIDGDEVDIIRANYLLRALMVPAGQHDIEFRFEPSSFAIGQTVAGISSLLVLLLIMGAIIVVIRQKKGY